MARQYGWRQGECDYCGKERSVETVYPWGAEDEGMARCFVCAKEHERGRDWDRRKKAYVEVDEGDYAPNPSEWVVAKTTASGNRVVWRGEAASAVDALRKAMSLLGLSVRRAGRIVKYPPLLVYKQGDPAWRYQAAADLLSGQRPDFT